MDLQPLISTANTALFGRIRAGLAMLIKGQSILKANYGVSDSSKKNEQNSLRILSWVCLVHFLEESRTSYFAFEIYWPLAGRSKTAHKIIFSHLYFNFICFKYKTIVKSSAWSFGHSDSDLSSVSGMLTVSLCKFKSNLDPFKNDFSKCHKVRKWAKKVTQTRAARKGS